MLFKIIITTLLITFFERINICAAQLMAPTYADTKIHAIHRHDSVHFSDFGMAAYAQLWFTAIKNEKEKTVIQ